MVYGWDAAAKLMEKHMSTGGIFVRLANDGDKISGAFCGEPYARDVHWLGGKQVLCTGEGCELCAKGERKSLRVSFNFYDVAEDTMKIAEGGANWFKDLIKVRDKYGLEKWFFELERHGQAGDSKTRYSILPDGEIAAQHKASIEKCSLFDLPKTLNNEGEDKFDSYDKKTDAVIDEATVAELMPRLKALPKTELAAWLELLKIEKVRELKAENLRMAHKILDEFEQHTETNEEIDPFK